ncbi:histidinol-phosphate transaminase [Stomatohabitans albus]|uniref:histidinol-phosphate transaminase n=1 Tax=Stomatohabitans albus TaxID=3110766 RepID=UPI00300C03E0
MNDRVPVREDLQGVEPYGAPQWDIPVRINTNEMPEGPPKALIEAVAARLPTLELNRYPDRDALELRTKLGALVDLPPAQTWVANGSNEVLTQLLQAYGGVARTVLLFNPGYSAHPLLAQVTQTTVVTEELDDNLHLTPAIAQRAVERHQPSLVIIASPVNPTGVVVPDEAIRALHDASSALIVLDEAYIQLANEPNRAITLMHELPRLVVCRTYSKAWRMAGLRLGYCYGPSWVIEDIQKVRLPYHLNAITQLVGTLALDVMGDERANVAEVIAERERVFAQLNTMPSVHAWPSEANFILFHVPQAHHVFTELVARGVLVRDFSTGPRTPDCLRASIGTRTENDQFLSALRTILTTHPV